MSELLRKANELTALNVASERGPHYDGWPCHGKYPCMYTDDALYVIKGYQDLIRRIIAVVGQGFLHDPTTVSACQFVIEGVSQVDQLVDVIVEAKASIPWVKS